MSNIKFSIIIPHKNTPELLVRCLDSIPKRDDVEVIIVDDNSDPSIVDFHDFPGLGEKDVEIIFTKEGKGAGYARNVGIDRARGEWLLFADADDYFFTENLNALLDSTLPEDCEVVAWSYMRIDSMGNHKWFTLHENLKSDQNIVRFDNRMNLLKYCTPWSKMEKSDFIKRNNIRFEETLVSNDVMFAAMVSVFADHYYFYNTDCYCYIKRDQSLTKTVNVENIKTRLEVSIRVDEFVKRNGKYYEYDGLYGNWLAQIHYPTFFKVFLKDIKENGFRNAYQRYSIACCYKNRISKVPYYTYFKRKLKKTFKK